MRPFRARDLDDVATILERRFKELDWRYIHQGATQLGIEGLLKQVVEEFMKSAGLEGRPPF